MKRDKTVVYVKGDRHKRIEEEAPLLEDLVSLECEDKQLCETLNKVQAKELFPENKQRVVVSILDIISLINQNVSDLIIINEGETDMIYEYGKQENGKKIPTYLKAVPVVLITFFGSAFSIMSFNNDISVRHLFRQIYYMMTGIQTKAITPLEIFYCIGIGIGIIVFFDHFGRNRILQDPTPTEIELKKYLKDSQDVVIENFERQEAKKNNG